MNMISVEHYREQVVALVGAVVPAERVALADAAGRVLADDLMARLPVPPFDNSAMDGFAVRSADTSAAPVTLPVVGESAAGAGDIARVGPGTAVRVMTGGRLPMGADAVVPVEWTDQPAGAAPVPEQVRIDRAVAVGRHVRLAGGDVEAGRKVLAAGHRLSPAALAAAASIGYGEVSVRRRVRVAVLSTGAELVAPGHALAAGEIPDSNADMLAALATRDDANVVVVQRVGDDPGRLAAALADLPQVDVVFTTGGVSAGAYEPVRQLGGDLTFSAVAMQPGKPQGCGLVGGVPLLAFPGNPVSSYVSFLAFGRPLLDALTGAVRRQVPRVGRSGAAWTSPVGRRQFVPVRLADDGETVVPSHAGGSGSHLIASLHVADAFAIIAEATAEVAVGDRLPLMEV